MILERASHELQEGNCEEAYSLILPLIKKRVPEALFLYSQFSLSGSETDQEFENRSISLLKECTDLDYPPAMFSLGVCYELGDLVGRDSGKGAQLIKKAAELGYSKAKLSYGKDLFYGSNGIEKDEILGISYLEQAVEEEVEGAADELEVIRAELKK